MGLCSFAFLLIPNPSLAPWKRYWGCGAWAAQHSHCWIPRGDPGLGTGKQNPVGLRLLWLCPLWSSPWWLQAVCPKPRAGPGSDFCGSCGLWLQTWGIFIPQDMAAPWETARGCRKGCRKLLPRLVLPWNVGTALGLSLFWVIPGYPAAPALPVELRDGNSLGCSPAPRAAPGLPELLSVLFPPPGMCFLSEHSW